MPWRLQEPLRPQQYVYTGTGEIPAVIGKKLLEFLPCRNLNHLTKLAAQFLCLLHQCHVMPTGSGTQGCFAAGRAAADDQNLPSAAGTTGY